MANPEVAMKPSTAIGVEGEFGRGLKVLDRLNTPIGHARVAVGHDSLLIRVLATDSGGFALRAGYLAGNQVLGARKAGEGYELDYSAGKAIIHVETDQEGLFRVKTSVIPSQDLTLPFIPRDVYPIDGKDNSATTEGLVHVTQSGLGCPMVYWSMTEPEIGSFLYFQNYTALNPYFNQIGQAPNDAVGGRWPELGYLPPTSPDKPLTAGQEMLISDAIICFDPEVPRDPRSLCDLNLRFVAKVYAVLEKSSTERRDWIGLTKKALKDLETAPTASVFYWNCRYLHPYNGAETPDSAVQLNVTHALEDYGNWLGKEVPLRDELFKGVSRFYDADLKTLRRYLPNAPKEKDQNEVDAWYMYHPLMTLGRLARDGDKNARKLLFDSLPFSIDVAHRFKYIWPVLFKLDTKEVIRAERREGELGQTDVAGLYAYVMMQAFDLTEDKKYLEEAKAALGAVKGFAFNLCYQTNITAWGVAACARVYKATGDPYYLEALKVFGAAFFRHTIFWESDIGIAKHYPVFLGTLCLDKGPYMAIFECHESYEAFTEALTLCQDDLPDYIRALLAESCKYGEQRAWSYHPGFLPEEVLSKEVRNGKIDRKLHFPLEDLYPDGKPAGQVGQEVYGCGASFAYLTNSFHRTKGAAFLTYCEYPIKDKKDEKGRSTFTVCGSPLYQCRLEFLADGRKEFRLPQLWINGHEAPPAEKHIVSGDSRIELRWKLK